jgi:hypothetical protein
MSLLYFATTMNDWFISGRMFMDSRRLLFDYSLHLMSQDNYGGSSAFLPVIASWLPSHNKPSTKYGQSNVATDSQAVLVLYIIFTVYVLLNGVTMCMYIQYIQGLIVSRPDTAHTTTAV